jgi:hypothetical protein
MATEMTVQFNLFGKHACTYYWSCVLPHDDMLISGISSISSSAGLDIKCRCSEEV